MSDISIPRNTVLVWRFEDAPAEYLAVRPTDWCWQWVAFVPNSVAVHPPLLDALPYDIAIIPVDGGRVYFGAHA